MTGGTKQRRSQKEGGDGGGADEDDDRKYQQLFVVADDGQRTLHQGPTALKFIHRVFLSCFVFKLQGAFNQQVESQAIINSNSKFQTPEKLQKEGKLQNFHSEEPGVFCCCPVF